MANITAAGTSDFPTSLDTRNTLTGGSSGSDILVEHYNGGAASIINIETVLGVRKTQGSVLFAGTSGNYAESNAQLFWDNLNNRLGIGTATPLVALDVVNTFNIRGVGPHAIGGVTDQDSALALRGTFAGTVSAYGLNLFQTLTVPVNGSSATQVIGGTINKAASGTHADFASLQIAPPTIGAGASALTNASTLKITGAPTGATNNYALWIGGGAGATRVDTSLFFNSANQVGTLANTALAFGDFASAAPGAFTERMRMISGILALGTTVTTGAVAGQMVVNNGIFYAANNAAGTGILGLVGANSSNQLWLNANSANIAIANAGIQTTIGANGAASALTANPVGYLKVVIAGINQIVPYYNQ